MIDFKLELKKYKPILEIDSIEASVNNGNEIKDIIDLLSHIANKEKPRPREQGEAQ